MKNYFNSKDFMEQYKSCNKDLHIAFNDRPTMQRLLEIAYKNGFRFWNNIQSTADELWDMFFVINPKNAKPIIHFYYNSICGYNEISLTYAANEKTYPQYKNFVCYYVYD